MKWSISSHCGDNGSCVEVCIPDLNWIKSRRSAENGDCVEVARTNMVLLRDSKLGDASPILKFNTKAWKEFLETIKSQ